jgi:hypothetical protein
MIFSAIPWLLGGGLLGPLGAAAVGCFCRFAARHMGYVFALFVVEFAFWAHGFRRICVSVIAHRHINCCASLLWRIVVDPIHTLFYVISALFTQWGTDIPPATARLDFAISNAYIVTLAFGGEMLVGGIVAQIISVISLPIGAEATAAAFAR